MNNEDVGIELSSYVYSIALLFCIDFLRLAFLMSQQTSLKLEIANKDSLKHGEIRYTCHGYLCLSSLYLQKKGR